MFFRKALRGFKRSSKIEQLHVYSNVRTQLACCRRLFPEWKRSMMKSSRWWTHPAGRCGIALLIADLGLTSTGYAVMFGQIDSFQNGSLQGWTNGPAPDPTNVATGGPAGAGDRFLQVLATGGFGAGSKLTTFNRTQWLGDYHAAQVSAIAMDLKNLDDTAPIQPLSVRIGFRQSTAPGAPGYVTTNAFALPADNAWHHAVFQLTGAAMIGVNAGALTLAQLLSDPAEMRILSANFLSLDGDSTSSKLGIDNIQAIPEPPTLALLGFAATMLLVYHRFSKVAPRRFSNSVGSGFPLAG